jgi:hypothetical protein
MRTSTCDGASNIRRRGRRATSQARPGLTQASSHSIAARFSTVKSGNAASALRCMPPIAYSIESWQTEAHCEDLGVTKACITLTLCSVYLRNAQEAGCAHTKPAGAQVALAATELSPSRHAQRQSSPSRSQWIWILRVHHSRVSEPPAAMSASCKTPTPAARAHTPHQLSAICCLSIQPSSA